MAGGSGYRDLIDNVLRTGQLRPGEKVSIPTPTSQKIKKDGSLRGPSFLSLDLCRLGLGSDSAHRASVSASAAVNAEVGVDFVDVSFGDSALGAFACACSTCYAVFRNFVSHNINNKC